MWDSSRSQALWCLSSQGSVWGRMMEVPRQCLFPGSVAGDVWKMLLAGSFPAGFHLEVTFCGSTVPLGS